MDKNKSRPKSHDTISHKGIEFKVDSAAISNETLKNEFDLINYKSDTVMQAILRLISNNKKILNKIEYIDELAKNSKELNEEQISTLKQYHSLNMVIQVLENVKPIIEVALDNEIKIHVQKALNQKKNITTNVKKENSEFSEKQIGGSLGDDDGQTHHDNNENGGEGMELSITHAKFYIDKILDIIYFIKIFGSKERDVNQKEFNEEEISLIQKYYEILFPEDMHMSTNNALSAQSKSAIIKILENTESSHDILALMEKTKATSYSNQLNSGPVAKNIPVDIESHQILPDNISDSEESGTPLEPKASVSSMDKLKDNNDAEITAKSQDASQKQSAMTPNQKVEGTMLFPNIDLSNGIRPFLPFHSLCQPNQMLKVTTCQAPIISTETNNNNDLSPDNNSNLVTKPAAITSASSSPSSSSSATNHQQQYIQMTPNVTSIKIEEEEEEENKEDAVIQNLEENKNEIKRDVNVHVHVSKEVSRMIVEEGLEARAREPRIPRQRNNYQHHKRQMSGGSRGSYGSGNDQRNGNPWMKRGGRNYGRGGGHMGRGRGGRNNNNNMNDTNSQLKEQQHKNLNTNNSYYQKNQNNTANIQERKYVHQQQQQQRNMTTGGYNTNVSNGYNSNNVGTMGRNNNNNDNRNVQQNHNHQSQSNGRRGGRVGGSNYGGRGGWNNRNAGNRVSYDGNSNGMIGSTVVRHQNTQYEGGRDGRYERDYNNKYNNNHQIQQQYRMVNHMNNGKIGSNINSSGSVYHQHQHHQQVQQQQQHYIHRN